MWKQSRCTRRCTYVATIKVCSLSYRLKYARRTTWDHFWYFCCAIIIPNTTLNGIFKWVLTIILHFESRDCYFCWYKYLQEIKQLEINNLINYFFYNCYALTVRSDYRNNKISLRCCIFSKSLSHLSTNFTSDQIDWSSNLFTFRILW